ncbi:hypothetical protein [Bosea sp. LC85]|uniref:hypothetical protein n=1 Tax=Bosea sp. LC85 TaxID=1502851 RepID=UPI000696446B|nr:hypothetical protein [Bosea sp. LC85]
MSSTFVQTTLDYLTAFKHFGGFEVDYVHATHHASIGFDFESYDIVFHSYCARLCFEGYVSDSYRERLKKFSGIKVLSVQDEYDNTDVLRAAIKDLGFDIVLTCVPQDGLEYVYPRSEFPNVEFITVFTGYVPDDFASDLPPPKPLAERSIFVGYRGRDIGGRYGRLGFDKFEIGRRMKELCAARGIETDIAMNEASRIYGKAWFDFVGDCRAMLGSESGSNVFDFDGSIDARFKEMTAANGGVPPSYADFLPIVADRDGAIEMGQISPRVLECAMMRTPMVLFKGRYSDTIAPNEHYITLEKDFSNVDEVLARLRDLPALEAMTQRAFDHLVASKHFTYRTFYAGIAAAIERHLVAKNRTPAGRSGVSPAMLDSSGLLMEHPTALPEQEESFQLRKDVAESVLYRSEVDRLIVEFSHLRSLLQIEIRRNYASFGREMALFKGLTQIADICRLTMPRPVEVSDFSGVLAGYDAEMLLEQPRRAAASASFRSALSFGDDRAMVAAALRNMLEIEKAGYFNMIEWIERLNKAYDCYREEIAQAYGGVIELVPGVLSQLTPRERLRVRFLSAIIRLRRARMSTLRGIVRSRLAQRVLTALPAIEPLAKRIAARLRSSGWT